MAGEALLIVDDHPQNLKLARVLLTGEGYQVRTAADAAEALAELQSWQPAMILLDLQLRGLDGFELARSLKADHRYRHILLMAVTACAMKGDETKARAAGCDAYVTKPIDVEQLPRAIAALLAGAAT